jgi:uncharacterized protein (DUF1501 family)
MLTRRVFMRGGAMVMAGMGAAPAWLARAAEGGGGKRKILVAIFQRGAADGLNVVVPFAEKRYYELRPTIGIPAPGGPNGAIDLDGRFALNPALQPLKALWDKQQLAIVEATGSMRRTRWNRERRAKPAATGGSIARYRLPVRKLRRSGRLRWEHSCLAPCVAAARQ